jgi:hypothetical protein
MPLLQRLLAPVEQLLYGAISLITGGSQGDDFDEVEDRLAA